MSVSHPSSTIRTPSTVSPYNSYTSRSICRSVATICAASTLCSWGVRAATLVQCQHLLDQQELQRIQKAADTTALHSAVCPIRWFLNPLQSPALDNPHLLLAQSVQRIHQPVNLPIRRVDLGGENALLVRGAYSGATLVQREHLLDQRHHARVARRIGRCGAIRPSSRSARMEYAQSGADCWSPIQDRVR